MRNRAWVLVALAAALFGSTPIIAQGTGSIAGTVSTGSGEALPGVMVEATGDVLPQARTTQTDANGAYRFRLLPPGNYELSFSIDGMATEQRALKVLLQETARVDVTMRAEAVSEIITVVSTAAAIDPQSAEIKASLDDVTIDRLPVGQEYRDLVKLIPGRPVHRRQSVRGPSAGGSGQDNVYQFDGVNVGLPLFGNLSAEPSSVDIEQVCDRSSGGAKATDFNRSGGFTMNTHFSKSGTGTYHGTAQLSDPDRWT